MQQLEMSISLKIDTLTSSTTIRNQSPNDQNADTKIIFQKNAMLYNYSGNMYTIYNDIDKMIYTLHIDTYNDTLCIFVCINANIHHKYI